MSDRELMQQALDALFMFVEYDYQGNPLGGAHFNGHRAIEALRARLAQPEPEPQEAIAKWIKTNTEHREWYICPKCSHQTPRFKDEWQGLTTQEIADETDIATSSNKDIFDFRKVFWCGARWAEDKLKEKNT